MREDGANQRSWRQHKIQEEETSDRNLLKEPEEDRKIIVPQNKTKQNKKSQITWEAFTEQRSAGEVGERVKECQTEGGNVTRLTDGWGWGVIGWHCYLVTRSQDFWGCSAGSHQGAVLRLQRVSNWNLEGQISTAGHTHAHTHTDLVDSWIML